MVCMYVLNYSYINGTLSWIRAETWPGLGRGQFGDGGRAKQGLRSGSGPGSEPRFKAGTEPRPEPRIRAGKRSGMS